ncbi:MAG: ribonuclease HII [Bacteroidota bacterium]
MLKPYLKKNRIEVGCDEAGRGCLAGPVFAAAVILPKNYKNKQLNDSKLLTAQQRQALKKEIEATALYWAVAKVDHKGIDKINILNASFKAMHKAIKKLAIQPEHILVDGNRFNPYKKIPFDCIIKGDSKYASIAAASILAKTYRDAYMERLHKKFPYYSWDTNKGYPTQAHRDAIVEHGPCPYHRQSFRLYPLPVQGSLFE